MEKFMIEDLMRYCFFILSGYLSGSILFADLIPRYFCHVDTTGLSSDGNPGAFNAFKYAGKKAGIPVIILELFKGFLPVYLGVRTLDTQNILFSLVLAAPVIGHAFPFYRPKKGGKAIAVSFGCLIGLFPNLYPALLLAAFYLLFSLVLVIRPHLLRTIITYVCFSISSIRHFHTGPVLLGALIISLIVILKHIIKYEKEPVSIRLGQRNH